MKKINKPDIPWGKSLEKEEENLSNIFLFVFCTPKNSKMTQKLFDTCDVFTSLHTKLLPQ